MFEKPEDMRMTKAEAEKYGREIDAKNLEFEHAEWLEMNKHPEESVTHVELSEEEIKKRVGEQNFENVKDGSSMGSINS